ncbi:MAG: glycosyltransferase family 2 protein [Clostridia bacterium]|nr:glycosyltransferase family 2 protein [Clostridia bacterium]
MKNEVLYIVVPAFNEAGNIDRLIEEWYPIVERHKGNGQSRLLVIDDGSSDSTYEMLTEKAADRVLLETFTKENEGHGPTLITGYRYAIIKGADWIFQTDSDGQTDSRDFEKFWDARNEYDAIIGNRALRQDGAARVFVERVLRMMLRLFFGTVMPDSNAPFRLMKRELLEKYIHQIPEKYNLPNVMLTTFFLYFNENVKFTEISFGPRRAGINSVNAGKIVSTGWKALKDFYQFRKDIKA